MINRFRDAMKGTGREILNAGKNEDDIDKFSEEKEIEKDTQKDKPKASPEYNNYDFEAKSISNDENDKQIEDVTLESVFPFLQDKINLQIDELRINSIKDIVNSLIDYSNTSKPILLCDFKDNIPNWISAIKYVLPKKIIDSFKFITYTIDSDTVYCVVCGINKNVLGVARLYEEDKTKYYVYNFIKGVNTTPEINTRFARLVQVYYSGKESILTDFIDFIDEFDYRKLDSEIDSCLDLYYLINYGINRMDYSAVVYAMNFANKYADIELCSSIFDKMEQILTKISSSVDESLSEHVFEFILKIANEKNDEEYFTKAYKFIYQCIQNMIRKTDDSSIGDVYSFYERIMKLSTLNIEDFVSYTLSSDNIRQLRVYSGRSESKYSRFYLMIVLKHIIKSNKKLGEISEYEDFIKTCISSLAGNKNEMRDIIYSVKDNQDYYMYLIVLYYNKIVEISDNTYNDAFKFYIDAIQKFDINDSSNLKNKISKLVNGNVLLFEEFKYKLNSERNKKEFFWNYYEKVFKNVPEFRAKYFSISVEHYLNAIYSEDYYSKECVEILKLQLKGEIKFSKEILVNITSCIEKQLKICEPDEDIKMLLDNLIQIKKEYNIETKPDIISLVDFGTGLAENNDSHIINDIIEGFNINLENATYDNYQQFVSWVVDILLSKDDNGVVYSLRFLNKIKDYMLDENIDFIDFMYDDRKMNVIMHEINDENHKKVILRVLVIIREVIDKNKSLDDNDVYSEFINNAVLLLCDYPDELELFLRSINNNIEYYSKFLLIAFKKLCDNSQNIIDYFITKSEKEPQWGIEARNTIFGMEAGEDFLMEEFKAGFSKADNKPDYFWNYYLNVFETMDDYKNSKLSDAVCLYLEQLSGEESYVDECVKILFKVLSQKMTLNNEALTKIVKEFENTLSLSNPGPDNENIIYRINEIKQEYNIVTSPDITKILEFGLKITKGSSDEIISMFNEDDIQLDLLYSEQYSEFINWVFSEICAKINFIENSQIIKKVLYVEANSEIFMKLFNEQFIDELNKNGSLADSQLQIRSIFNSISGNLASFCNLIVIYYTKMKDTDENIAVDLFIELLDKKEDSQAFKIREYISNLENGDELLYAEATSRLQNAGDKITFFWNYWDDVVTAIHSFKDKYYERIISEYLEIINGFDYFANECMKFMNMLNEGIVLSKDIIEKLIQGYETIIDISEPDDETSKLIENINNMKKKYEISTSPDVVGMINLGRKVNALARSGNSEVRKFINSSNIDLKCIRRDRYEEFIDWCLPPMISCVNSWQVHSTIKRLLYVEEFRLIFFTKYLGILMDVFENDKNDGYLIFSQFIIYYFNVSEQFGDEISALVRTTAVNILTRQAEAKIKDCDNNVKGETSSMRNRELILNEWDQIIKKVNYHNRNNSGEKANKKGFSFFKR